MPDVATAEEIKCTHCGEPLDQEEAASPRRDEDGDGDILCDECWHLRYEFTCCRCEEYDHVKVQHRYLVVFEEVQGLSGMVKPGLYRISELPYWADGMIEYHFYETALERVGDVPKIARWNPRTRAYDLIETLECNYPCGHLCSRCQEALFRRVHNTCTV